jgi:hypothetical protein
MDNLDAAVPPDLLPNVPYLSLSEEQQKYTIVATYRLFIAETIYNLKLRDGVDGPNDTKWEYVARSKIVSALTLLLYDVQLAESQQREPAFCERYDSEFISFMENQLEANAPTTDIELASLCE